MAFLTPADLAAFETIDADKAQEMIDDATAIAVLAAPCLADEEDLTPQQIAATKAVLRGAILRWNEAGSGAFVQQTAGPFSTSADSRQQRRSMFWPSEIEQLQSICSSDDTKAYAIDTAPGTGTIHADVCAVNFGASYCSCGASLAGFPIYEDNP